MKIGTSLFMIVTILIGFGFVLADNLHIRQNLQEMEGVVANSISLKDEAIQELAACQVIASNQESEIQILRFENANHLAKISQLESEDLDIKNDPLHDSYSNNKINIDPIATSIIVVTQIVLFFFQKVQQTKLGFHMPLTDSKTKGQSVYLTKEELKFIIEMRRKKIN